MADRVLCEVIRAVREARGLTQEQLGALCVDRKNPNGRTQPAVAQWESGAAPLSEAVLETVAAALKMRVRDLLVEGLRRSAS